MSRGRAAAGVPGNRGRVPGLAPRWSVQGRSWSRQFGDQRYGVARAHRAGRPDAGVEAAHPPAWGGEIALLDLLVVDLELERFPVDIERRTGPAGLGDLQHCAAGANLDRERVW